MQETDGPVTLAKSWLYCMKAKCYSILMVTILLGYINCHICIKEYHTVYFPGSMIKHDHSNSVIA